MPIKYNESTAPMKDLMTVAPIDPAVHAKLLRGKVAARRLFEDLRETAKLRRDEPMEAR